jgi:NAD(P)H-dependent flavin oxidoreductase YrpB (nitropropane dioxygenase family)
MNAKALPPDMLAPIVQAPMAGANNHRLAAAVCEAGGLGSLPAAMLSTADRPARSRVFSISRTIPSSRLAITDISMTSVL